MKIDPIVEEIRAFRAAHAAKHGNDLDRIFIDIKKKEKRHLYKLINRETQNINDTGQELKQVVS